MAILRQHAQEETLDRILRWVATGALSYSPQTADGDRLENYINSATKIVNRAIYRGVDCEALRDALDAATSTQRQAIEIRRRARLDGMRMQVREKAERFLAEREARRPAFNISGRVVQVGDQIFSGQFYGPVAGTGGPRSPRYFQVHRGPLWTGVLAACVASRGDSGAGATGTSDRNLHQ
jgi:hypothetical protein